jgi:hypothetical protein
MVTIPQGSTPVVGTVADGGGMIGLLISVIRDSIPTGSEEFPEIKKGNLR